MTRSLRDARICTAVAVVFLAAGITTAALSGITWLILPGLYVTAFFTWVALRLRADHHRTLAEHDWARRNALGQCPPPLDPCCHLGRASGGTTHDLRRCTDSFHRIVAQLTTSDRRSAA
ncbi:hypothetical protein [Streptomyces sp. NPDC003299]